MMNDLQGKVAIVVGGTTGIGSATVHRLAELGTKVVFCGLEPEIGAAQEEALRRQARDASYLFANVTVASDVKKLVEFAAQTHGGVDILVNSAGIQRYGDVVETTESDWDEVMAVNLKSVFLASKYAVPEMRKRGGGTIVNVASVQGYASQIGVAAYTASKGGILAVTRAMAIDHARDRIRVNAVCPASVDTPMLRNSAELFKGNRSQVQMLENWGSMHPLGRIAKPEEVAELIVFLVSERASFITGGDYKIDGGMMAMLGVRLPE